MDKERFLMGSETEYASIAFDQRGPTDIKDLALCLKIIRQETRSFAPQPTEFFCWRRREPHQFPEKDVRAFAAILENRALRKKFEKREGIDADSRLFCELGMVTPEGGRVYIDLRHIEYATPECPDPYELIRCERNFAAVLAKTQEKFFRETGRKIFFFKNNSDGQGNSYSHHLNFCLPRPLFEELIFRERGLQAAAWATFLATGVIFSGTGKIGAENGRPPCDFQISQRADFFSHLHSEETTSWRRALINTRDEPLADAKKYGRLHVIFDDTPMADATLFLSAGAKALVLKMLEDENCAAEMPILGDPLGDLPAISRDLACAKKYEFRGRAAMTAAEAQLAVWRLARNFFKNTEATWVGDLLEMWGEAAREIGRDPLRLKEWLDWPLLFSLLRNGDFGGQKVKAIELMFRGVDPATGIFWKKEKQKLVKRLAKDGPPSLKGTRAFFRGFLARERSHALRDLSWETAVFRDEPRALLMDPFLDDELDHNPARILFKKQLPKAHGGERRKK